MRIASLSPAATEILFVLGKGKEIVCVDQFSNFPEDAKELPHVMDHQRISSEALRSFSPDLVLTQTVIQEALSTKLKEDGFSVVHQDPRKLSELFEAILATGILVDAEQAASRLISGMQKELKDLQKKARLLPKKLTVYCEEWHRPPMASGNWVPEMIAAAGGRSFPIDPGQLSREVSLEEVAMFDPSLIVISWCGAGRLADKYLLLQRPEWDQLEAVRNGNVKVIDDSLLNRPGPRLIEGARQLYGWLFEMLH